MAKVNVKLFGVLRMGTGLAQADIDVTTVAEIFDVLNKQIAEQYPEKKALAEAMGKTLPQPDILSFKDAIIYVNEERCPKKKRVLADGDKIMLLSPASGG